MATYTFKLGGWQGLLVIAVLLLFIGYRLASLGDELRDPALIKSVELELQSEHYPGQVAALRQALDSGSVEHVDQVVETLTGDRIGILSLNASYPVFSLGSPRDLVVKVRYTAMAESGEVQTRTRYLHYSHNALGNLWRYQRPATASSYYLNFF